MADNRNISKSAGHVPGTPIHIGEKKIAHSVINLISYNQNVFEEKKIESFEELQQQLRSKNNLWINIEGVSDTVLISKVGEMFGLHPLLLEDIVDTSRRPKFEDFGQYIFIVLKMIYYDSTKKEIQSEQVSLVFGDNYCLTFQEQPGDIFKPIRDRLKNDKGRIRKAGTDYLVYSLIDAIIDNYFIILERLGDHIEGIESELISQPDTATLRLIYSLKRDAAFLRRSVWPLREVISSLQRNDFRLIKKPTFIYLRDIYDHTIQVIDTIETFRDMLSGMLDIYLSSISNRMNEVMKVLTIIATIFIPLTFVAGVYGMNFEYMPELHHPWAYPIVLGLMLAILIGMLFYFRKKRWI